MKFWQGLLAVVLSLMLVALVSHQIANQKTQQVFYKLTSDGWKEVSMKDLCIGDTITGDDKHECKFIVLSHPYIREGRWAIDLAVKP